MAYITCVSHRLSQTTLLHLELCSVLLPPSSFSCTCILLFTSPSPDLSFPGANSTFLRLSTHLQKSATLDSSPVIPFGRSIGNRSQPFPSSSLLCCCLHLSPDFHASFTRSPLHVYFGGSHAFLEGEITGGILERSHCATDEMRRNFAS